MSFKKWLNELVYPGEPDKERPEVFVKAIPGIFSQKDYPPTSRKKTPTTNYIPKKYMKKA